MNRLLRGLFCRGVSRKGRNLQIFCPEKRPLIGDGMASRDIRVELIRLLAGACAAAEGRHRQTKTAHIAAGDGGKRGKSGKEAHCYVWLDCFRVAGEMRR